MKILPIQNNYVIQDYSTYYNTNNYQYYDNFQPKQSLQRQTSSSLLTVRNNLLNTNPKMQTQQQIPQIQQQQQIPLVELDLQNAQQVIPPTKCEPKIIRIQKKIYKRNINQKKPQLLMQSRSLDYFGNPIRNLSFDSSNYNYYNNNANIFFNTKDIYSLMDTKPISNHNLNEYEITSPIKKNKVNSYIPLYQDSSKTEIKYQNQNQNNTYLNNYTYLDYKQNNNDYNINNMNTVQNINYSTNIIPIENDYKINNVLDTKINTSMNNVTNNYLQTNDINDYFSNSNNNVQNYKNVITEPLNINNFYDNANSNSSTNQNSYASNSFQIPKMTASHSSSNLRANNDLIKNKNNIVPSQIQIKNPILARSISSGNINYNKEFNYNYNYNNQSPIQTQSYKNEHAPHKKLHNITIIKDPMITNNVNNIYKNDIYSYYQNQNNISDSNYSKQDLSSYSSSLTTQNNNSNINNNYNINFNININHDYNNQNNKNILNNQSNPLQIQSPKLEPSSNFNLLEFIKLGVMGRGTEGIIYSVKWKKNNKKYALKKSCIKLIEVVKKRQEEINMLKEFRQKTKSDGVINIYGYLCITNKHNCYDFYEIMELAEIDWDQEIENRGQLRLYYPEHELMSIMYQIVQTFSLLQQNHITHRDIKPQNIIIVNGKYKIIDFGNARILKRDGLVIQRIRGSEMYMSPVMFKGYHSKMPRVKHNTYKSDVFSLGMCFLLAASLSYTPLNMIREEYNINVIGKIIRNYIGQRYSENVYNILFAMLQVEETLRPDFIQLENIFRKINGYV